MRDKFYFKLCVLLFCHCMNALCDDVCSKFVKNSKNIISEFHNEVDNYLEYGIGKYPKSLHCCATNYNSILWFKNNKLYPWRTEESSFVLDPDSNNQTLHVENLSTNDDGTYTCSILTKDSVEIRHFRLKVYGHEFSGTPVVTRKPPLTIDKHENETVRMYCETFVGKIDLPDARIKIGWYKIGINNTKRTLTDTNRIFLQNVNRDKGLTIGLQLVIENLEKEDFGQYVCSVSNTGDQITEMTSELVNSGRKTVHYLYKIFDYFIIIVLVTVVCLFLYKYGHKITMYTRLYVIAGNNERNKEFDACILFDPDESEFTKLMLIPTLLSYNYKISSYVLHDEAFLSMDCQARISVSKIILIVLPYPRDGDLLDQKVFTQKLYAALNASNKILCLLVQEKPVFTDRRNTEMISSMKHITYMKWPMYKKDWSQLWTLLRSHLPSKRTLNENTNSTNLSVINDKNIDCSV